FGAGLITSQDHVVVATPRLAKVADLLDTAVAHAHLASRTRPGPLTGAFGVAALVHPVLGAARGRPGLADHGSTHAVPAQVVPCAALELDLAIGLAHRPPVVANATIITL